MNDYSMKPCDLIFYQEGDKTKSLGFEINNVYLNKMPAIIQTNGVDHQPSFAVPAGLFLLHQTLDSITNPSQIPIKETTIISDTGAHENIETDLYNRLLKLVEPTRQIKQSNSPIKSAPKSPSKSAPKSSSKSAPKSAPKSTPKSAPKSAPKSTPKSAPIKSAPIKSAPKSASIKPPSKQTRKMKAKNKKKTRKNKKKNHFFKIKIILSLNMNYIPTQFL